MSIEHTRLCAAELDRDAIDMVEEIIRNALLMALSEARAVKFGEARIRDKLMDGLSSQFHPDNQIDQFTDAFTDARSLADAEVESRQDEMCLQAAE